MSEKGCCPKNRLSLVDEFVLDLIRNDKSMQLVALVLTIVVAGVGGFLTGVLLKIPFCVPSNKKDAKCTGIGKNGDERQWYDDKLYWNVINYKKNK